MHISSGLALLESLLQEKWSKGATFYHFARAPEKSGSKTRLNKPHSNSSRWNCEAQSVAVIVELCEVAPLKVLCCRLLRGKWGRGGRVGDGGSRGLLISLFNIRKWISWPVGSELENSVRDQFLSKRENRSYSFPWREGKGQFNRAWGNINSWQELAERQEEEEGEPAGRIPSFCSTLNILGNNWGNMLGNIAVNIWVHIWGNILGNTLMLKQWSRIYDKEFSIPHICHGHTDGVRGEKKLSCGEISNFCPWNMWRKLKFLNKWINFKFLHMTYVEKSEISFVVCTIYGILLAPKELL